MQVAHESAGEMRETRGIIGKNALAQNRLK